MNREFHVSQFRGTVVIIVAIVGLALLFVTLQLAGGLNAGEVQGLDPAARSQGQPVDVVELAESASGQRAYALKRGWKAEEIGEAVSIPPRAEEKLAAEDAVNLGYFLNAESAGVPVSRGWKLEEIGAEAASSHETLRPAVIEDALSLGSYFKASPYTGDFETARTMESKIETMLADEATEAGHPIQTEGCQPEPGFSQEPC